jgi:hypothetical protein
VNPSLLQLPLSLMNSRSKSQGWERAVSIDRFLAKHAFESGWIQLLNRSLEIIHDGAKDWGLAGKHAPDTVERARPSIVG